MSGPTAPPRDETLRRRVADAIAADWQAQGDAFTVDTAARAVLDALGSAQMPEAK